MSTFFSRKLGSCMIVNVRRDDCWEISLSFYPQTGPSKFFVWFWNKKWVWMEKRARHCPLTCAKFQQTVTFKTRKLHEFSNIKRQPNWEWNVINPHYLTWLYNSKTPREKVFQMLSWIKIWIFASLQWYRALNLKTCARARNIFSFWVVARGAAARVTDLALFLGKTQKGCENKEWKTCEMLLYFKGLSFGKDLWTYFSTFRPLTFGLASFLALGLH